MRHSSSRSSADRHGSGIGRTAVETIDDSKLMQEAKHSLFADEQQDKVEHAHPYGFTAVPQKPSGSGKMRRAAEAFMSYMGSGRSHGVAVVVGDRRFRLFKLEAGEVALHDDQGHQIHFKRDGIWHSAPNSKKIVLQIMDDDKMPQDDDGNSGGSGGGGGGSSGDSGGGEQAQKMGQIKQAGRPAKVTFTLDKDSLTINHPKQINFTAPIIKNTASDHFSTVGETRLGADDASNPIYGVNGGVGMTTQVSGAKAVLVKAERPGPPTSLDAEP